MRFHLDKCKVLSVSLHINPWVGILPFSRFPYSLGVSILDYVESERDLGVVVNTGLSWSEMLQKRGMKWILSEEFLSYSCPNVYLEKCKKVNILPMSKRFDLGDLVFFHKLVYELIPLKFPIYISRFAGDSRLRSSHLDNLCFVSSIIPKGIRSPFHSNFYYRTIHLWNRLSFNIRDNSNPITFKILVKQFLWNEVLSEGRESEIE